MINVARYKVSATGIPKCQVQAVITVSSNGHTQALGCLDFGLGMSFADQMSQIKVEECHIGADNVTVTQCLRMRQQ